jgi:hypothetical protein
MYFSTKQLLRDCCLSAQEVMALVEGDNRSWQNPLDDLSAYVQYFMVPPVSG